jgi:hypothetical protein
MSFWWPSPFKFRFYLDIPGFWLLVIASVLLLGPLAVFRARDATPESLRRRKSEVLGAASVVVFVWIFFAFSHQYIGSWILYLWLAVWAVALLPQFFPKYSAVIALLVLISLNADRHQLLGSLPQWHAMKISSLFPDTFSQGNEDEQIKEILSAVQGRRTVVLSYVGAMSLLHDGLGEPLTEFFAPGIVLPGDELRMKSAAAAAEMVIVPTPPWYSSDREFFSWPNFLDKQKRYRLALRNPSGLVLAIMGACGSNAGNMAKTRHRCGNSWPGMTSDPISNGVHMENSISARKSAYVKFAWPGDSSVVARP